jgi:ribonuclease D
MTTGSGVKPSPVGPPRLIDTAAQFEATVDEIAAAPLYGFDTEFHRERTYYAKLALLQVAWPDGIALIDPLAVDVAGFRRVLEGPGIAIAHASDQDLEILDRTCGAVPRAMFDTQLAAGFMGMSTPSLGLLVERLLEVRLDKTDQLTDWTHRPLTAGQLSYAASDVAYLLALYEALQQRLTALGRLEWAEAECDLLLVAARRENDPDEAWWRLRQARQLRGAQRGVAQKVAAWRELRARAVDQPIRTVLPDLALAAIAHRAPRNRGELEKVRGLDPRHLGGGAAAELLAAAIAGEALTAAELHLPPPLPESVSRPAVALAAAYAHERARELDIDPSVLATRADIAAFLADPPAGRLVTSWRRDLLGEPLRRLVNGDALVVSGSSVVLEQRSGIRLVGTEPLRVSAPTPPVAAPRAAAGDPPAG